MNAEAIGSSLGTDIWTRMHKTRFASRYVPVATTRRGLSLLAIAGGQYKIGIIGYSLDSPETFPIAAGACPIKNTDKVHICVFFAGKCKIRVFHWFP
jgi:hypothetical protein